MNAWSKHLRRRVSLCGYVRDIGDMEEQQHGLEDTAENTR